MNVRWLLVACTAAATAMAQDKPADRMAAPAEKTAAPLEIPTAAEVKKLILYYYGGKDHGPILADFKACTKVDTSKDTSTRNECLEEVKGPVKKGANVHAWTMWMVPEGGDYEDVAIQYLYEGQVRSTMDIKLTTSFRSRTYRASTLSKPGKWTIKVVRGSGEQIKELGSIDVVVQ